MDLHHPLDTGLEQLGLSLSDSQKQLLIDFVLLLKKWNQAYNLTAINELDAMLSLHILDSLALAPYLYGERHIDVGTGPGLPGIPLAIAFPHHHFTLLDSNGKKTRFLQQVKLSLKLQNIEIVHARAEQYQPATAFSSIMSRAFASLKDMIIWTQNLGGKDTHFLAMKGIYPIEEIKELPKGFHVKTHYELKVPGVTGQRHVIVLVKNNS